MNNKCGGERSIVIKRAAISAVASMLITLALMLAGAWLICENRVSIEQDEKMVMLCVFLGALFGALLTIPRQGRGRLACCLTSGVMYIFLLIVFSMASGAEKIFGSVSIKMMICAMVGSGFGGALMTTNRTGKYKRRRK